MKIILNKLSIRNFKGIRDYELDPNGDSINVFGDNATGKTTLYDAFLWVLFGKNSEDQANFDWKPLDKDGNEINHLETEVVAEIEVDGQKKKLSRMTREDWVKKRGSASEVFDGHTTVYKMDDLSVKKKDYDAYLTELIDENLFKLLTNVSYFPENLKWQERRQTLIDMVGDVSDLDVIDKNNELEPLKALIKERPADELKQLTEQQMKQINKDIKALPNRIDEVDRSLPDISKLDKKKLLEERNELDKEVSKHQDEIHTIKNTDATVALQNEIIELRMHYREMKLVYEEQLEEELKDVLREKDAIETVVRETKAMIEKLTDENLTVERSARRKETDIKELEADKEKLRTQFFEIRDRKMDNFEAHQTTCPTCGQDLPESELLKAREVYAQEVESFNTNKALDLKANKEKGMKIATRIDDLNGEINIMNNGLLRTLDTADEQKEELEKLSNKLTKINGEVDRIKGGQNPFDKTDTALKITKQAEKLQKQIDSGQSNVTEDIVAINSKIAVVREKLEQITDKLSDLDLHARQRKRKDELIAQEQTLSVEYGELEQRLYLLEEFTRTKVNLLTDTINERFKLVKFKLFEEQINGGLKEVCEVTVNGANYTFGLNNAMKINAGLDIINTLMDYYDTYVPVFVDNAESINELIDIDTQLITLSVSNHKKLRVEVA